MKLQEIVKYKISRDGIGLLGYFNNKKYYHIHKNEMSKLEKWIWKLLKGNKK